jgi:hypothetical protein
MISMKGFQGCLSDVLGSAQSLCSINLIMATPVNYRLESVQMFERITA